MTKPRRSEEQQLLEQVWSNTPIRCRVFYAGQRFVMVQAAEGRRRLITLEEYVQLTKDRVAATEVV